MPKTILITGTSTGLGRLTAIHFAQQGWQVAATMRSPERETELQKIQNIKLIQLDVTDPQSVREGIDTTLREYGKIDVVVNNAGIGMYGALELTSETAIDQQYAVNVRGVINVIRAVLPHFRANKAGMFINIGSIMGLSTALPLGSLYNMSKFALEGLIEGLYFELKPLNIDLRLVEPGGFRSSFGDNTVFSESDTIHAYDAITANVKSAMKSSTTQLDDKNTLEIVEVIGSLANRKRNALRTVVGKDAKTLMLLRKMVGVNTFLNIIGKRFW